MANLNLTPFTSIPGIFKILTLVIGLITLILTADTYHHPNPLGVSKSKKEVGFLVILIALFSMSFVWALLICFQVLEYSGDKIKRIDIGFHIVGGFLLIAASIAWFVSVSDYESREAHGGEFEQDTIQLHVQSAIFEKLGPEDLFFVRLAAGGGGLLTAALYLAAGLFVWIIKSKETETLPVTDPHVQNSASAPSQSHHHTEGQEIGSGLSSVEAVSSSEYESKTSTNVN